ncbi:MAG: DUF3857 domain-containing protein [Cytophagales bacterium]|nr:MAG: DUF3857 domain-containing protein [Cytophagales bacterium]
MRKYLLLLLSFPALAQDEYRAAAIPESLRANAHAVVRRHETAFVVKSPGEATQRVRTVVTVLDAQGDDEARLIVGYDKLSKINDIWGALYDASGNQLKKLKKADIDDQSATDDGSFLTDRRLKHASFPRQPNYPYTVEFVYEATERNLMFYPTWVPQSKENRSVEQASLTITMPKGQALRYKAFNLNKPVERQDEANQTVYVWTLTNQPAIELESMAPPARELVPILYTAPTAFEVQDYTGTITNWKELGRFYHVLNRDRDALPAELKTQIVQLTAGEATAMGKIRKVYEFVQQNTRYVSVQLGIGGWQTIAAEKVAATKYGDCKALTNYTKALLNVVGIPAVEALVRAGDDEADILTDFPSFQFNHVILCVPNKGDTLYLECTSQTNPLGYNGTFTGNRHVLLVTPDGGRLTQTPHYSPADNRQMRRIDVILTEQGDATAQAVNRYTGIQSETRTGLLNNRSQAEQRTWLLEQVRIPNFELKKFSFSEQKTQIPVVTETLTLAVRKWATPSGSRLFVPLNLMSTLGPATPATSPRQQPLDLDANWNWQDTDTVSYQLPQGYRPEAPISPMTLTSAFGDYTAGAQMVGDRLVYTRRVTIRRGRHTATAYAEWVDFRKKIAKFDKVQLVLVKGEVATK